MSKIVLLNASCADQTVDAVVNAANDGLWAGSGISGVIFKKAGMSALTAACRKYKTPLKDGSVYYPCGWPQLFCDSYGIQRVVRCLLQLVVCPYGEWLTQHFLPADQF